MQVQLHSFLTSAVFVEDWLASRPGHFTAGKNDLFPVEQEVGWVPKSLWTLRGRDKSFTLAANRTAILRSSCQQPNNYQQKDTYEKRPIRLYLSCHFQLLFLSMKLPETPMTDAGVSVAQFAHKKCENLCNTAKTLSNSSGWQRLCNDVKLA